MIPPSISVGCIVLCISEGLGEGAGTAQSEVPGPLERAFAEFLHSLRGPLPQPPPIPKQPFHTLNHCLKTLRRYFKLVFLLPRYRSFPARSFLPDAGSQVMEPVEDEHLKNGK